MEEKVSIIFRDFIFRNRVTKLTYMVNTDRLSSARKKLNEFCERFNKNEALNAEPEFERFEDYDLIEKI